MEKIKFKNFERGYTDAEKEMMYNPKFNAIFHDINGTYDRLSDIRSPKSILLGKKGVGKTAYASKISSINGTKRLAFILKLHELPYNEFVKITDSNGQVLGTQRYLHSWYLLLLTSIVKKLKDEDVADKEGLKNLKKIIYDLGFVDSRDFVRDILTASKFNFKTNLPKMEFSIGYDGQQKIKFLNLTDLTNYFSDTYRTLGIIKEIFPVIDGVDDVLRVNVSDEEVKDILSGLIRAVDSLNTNNFYNNTKFLLVIRDDIAKIVNDPDMNKIIQDRGEKLDWYTNKSRGTTDNLILLFNKRYLVNKHIDLTNNRYKIWNSLFPRRIRNFSSWDYFLEYTMYRPRDVIQFLNQFIEKYPNHSYINIPTFNDELKNFSKDHFFEEMKNELIGFLDDPLVDSLYRILQKLGSEHRRNFKLSDMIQVYNRLGYNYQESKIQEVLLILFNLGYVGMVREVYKEGKTERRLDFKHKDPRYSFDPNGTFVIHKGLFSALNI